MNPLSSDGQEVNPDEMFEYCLNLAKTNPALLESELRAEILETILRAPKEKQQALLFLQRNIDAKLQGETNPVSRMHLSFQMMQDQFHAKDGFNSTQGLWLEALEENIEIKMLGDELVEKLKELRDVIVQLQKMNEQLNKN